MSSFPPIIGDKPTTLILGSMPSQISLQHQQYYANPQNAFWWILAQLCGFELGISYDERVACLKQAEIAVWDVLLDCIRPGSLDSSIVKKSERPNDLTGLISQCQSLELIAFNGRAAENIFLRHSKSIDTEFPEIKTVLLPSSSPAYASMSRESKLAHWRQSLNIKTGIEVGAKFKHCKNRSELVDAVR